MLTLRGYLVSVSMILLSMAISSSNQFSKEAKTRFGICFVAIVLLVLVFRPDVVFDTERTFSFQIQMFISLLKTKHKIQHPYHWNLCMIRICPHWYVHSFSKEKIMYIYQSSSPTGPHADAGTSFQEKETYR